jgi:hypothetical protein
LSEDSNLLVPVVLEGPPPGIKTKIREKIVLVILVEVQVITIAQITLWHCVNMDVGAQNQT